MLCQKELSGDGWKYYACMHFDFNCMLKHVKIICSNKLRDAYNVAIMNEEH